MKRTLNRCKLGITAGLLLGVTLCGATAQEKKVVVGKVIDIDGPRLYSNRLTPQSWYQAYMGMATYLTEKLRTDKETQAVLSFSLGARAGIGRNSQVEIVSLRNVEEQGGDRASMRIDAGTFWAKFDKQDKEFQIKTAGGVIGIEGTELLINVEEETGVTEVLLFEGQISVVDDKGNKKTMFPGDYAEFGGSKGMCVLSYPAPALRTLVVERFPKFSSFLATQNITSIPKPAGPTLIRASNDKKSDLLTALESSATLSGATASGLQSSGSSGAPTFSWSPVAGAESYAFFLTSDSNLQDILFSSRVDGTRFAVPEGAQGLPAGHYTWAVIPLNSEGEPVGPPAKAHLDTAGWTSNGLEIEQDV